MTINTEFTIPFTVIRLLSEFVSEHYNDNIGDVKELLSYIDEAKYQEVSKEIKEPKTIEETMNEFSTSNRRVAGIAIDPFAQMQAAVNDCRNEGKTYLKEITTRFLKAINSKDDTKGKLRTLIDDLKNHIPDDKITKLNDCLSRNNISFQDFG